ncbi:MAG: GatB/YqeY domain-containing protein [bacterium]|nr:GatB/YqeY domain-containing protein [bacterium]
MKTIMKEALKSAMKAQDKVKMEALRGALSAIQYEEMQAGVENLDTNENIAIIKREIKKKHEEIDFAKQANRLEKIESIQTEIATLESFLPQQMSASDLESQVKGFITANPGSNMGAVMKFLKEKFEGQYDGKMASEVVKKTMP